MVKPLFGKNSNPASNVAKTADPTIKKLAFPENSNTIVVPRTTSATPSPATIKFATAPTVTRTPVDALPNLVQLACTQMQTIDVSIYKKNSAYCAMQAQRLLPLKIDVVIDWGSKTVERMRDSTKEITGLMQLVTDTKCNEYIQSLLPKIKPSSNKIINTIKSKIIDVKVISANLQASAKLFTSLLPKCDSLLVSIDQHHNSVLLKLIILTAVSNVVGTIPDSSLDNAMYKRKILLQQTVTQAQMLMQQLKDIKTYMIDQKQQIDQLLTVTIPAFEAIR